MKATLVRGRKGAAGGQATDGARTVAITATQLRVTEHGKQTTYALRAPQYRGKEVEILSIALAPNANVIWAVLSDTFAVAQGRFVARLTWRGRTATWGPLKSPYGWSPYSHAGMFLERVGAATSDTVFLSAFSESSSVLARVGKHAHKGVPIARGHVAFGVTPPSLVVFADRKFRFCDATGAERASVGFSGAIKAAIGSPANICGLAVIARDLFIATHDHRVVQLLLDEDPPSLIATPSLAKPVVATAGPYGALDPSRFRSPQIVACERVRAWDLNESPIFTKPAPFAALVLQPNVLSFYKERDGRLRKGFDFMTSAIAVSTAPPPRGTPKGIVLASLRTPSGLTQVLCREEFAAQLVATTGPKKKRP